jgi:AhpD family alkylhydroperoxidase
MQRFQVPTPQDVSPANQAIFEELKKAFGVVPNLFATFAISETALGTYLALQSAKTSLSPKEAEVVNLVVSQVNECAYCLAAHTALGKMRGFTDAQILEIRGGRASFDDRFDALAKLVRDIALNRGHPEAANVEAAFEAGYTSANLVDVMVLIGDKTISNYLHGLTQVPIDFPAAPALGLQARTVAAESAGLV